MISYAKNLGKRILIALAVETVLIFIGSAVVVTFVFFGGILLFAPVCYVTGSSMDPSGHCMAYVVFGIMSLVVISSSIGIFNYFSTRPISRRNIALNTLECLVVLLIGYSLFIYVQYEQQRAQYDRQFLYADQMPVPPTIPTKAELSEKREERTQILNHVQEQLTIDQKFQSGGIDRDSYKRVLESTYFNFDERLLNDPLVLQERIQTTQRIIQEERDLIQNLSVETEYAKRQARYKADLEEYKRSVEYRAKLKKPEYWQIFWNVAAW